MAKRQPVIRRDEMKKKEPRKERPIVLVAGGTGGHVFPAISVALFLKRLGKKVIFITDERAEKWVRNAKKLSDSVVVHPLRRTSGRTSLWEFISRLLTSAGRSGWRFVRQRPAVVVGFGGYPASAPLLTAQILGIPTIIHECNCLLGRANAVLRPLAVLTTGFPVLNGVPLDKVDDGIFVGNPLREEFDSLKKRIYEPPKGTIRLLVTGGSQGSDFFAKLIPAALESLPQEVRGRLEVTHQVSDLLRPSVEAVYKRAGITCTLRPFFDDMPAQMAKAHLIIARSGALTVTEIMAAGLPSVLIPLGCSRDGDQLTNAQYCQEANAAVYLTEERATPKGLADTLQSLLTAPERLLQMSQAAKAIVRLDATERLAKLTLNLCEDVPLWTRICQLQE